MPLYKLEEILLYYWPTTYVLSTYFLPITTWKSLPNYQPNDWIYLRAWHCCTVGLVQFAVERPRGNLLNCFHFQLGWLADSRPLRAATGRDDPGPWRTKHQLQYHEQFPGQARSYLHSVFHELLSRGSNFFKVCSTYWIFKVKLDIEMHFWTSIKLNLMNK